MSKLTFITTLESLLHYICFMEEKFNIHVTLLQQGSNSPITGDDYTVKFYDQDIAKDDFLGEACMDETGKASVTIVPSDYSSLDSPMEKYPDLYFTVQLCGDEIYRSPVFNDQDLKKSGDFESKAGWDFDLGTFIIPKS